MRQTQNPTIDALINETRSEPERQLINGQRMFADNYRFSLSGQQSSDREALRMMNTVSSQFGDDEQTLMQKRNLRAVMIRVTEMKARGEISGVDGARMGLQAAQNMGFDTTEFVNVLDEAIETSREGADRPPGSAPTDPTNITERVSDERLNQLLDNLMRGPGNN